MANDTSWALSLRAHASVPQATASEPCGTQWKAWAPTILLALGGIAPPKRYAQVLTPRTCGWDFLWK